MQKRRLIALSLRPPSKTAPSIDIVVRPKVPFDTMYQDRLDKEIGGVRPSVAVRRYSPLALFGAERRALRLALCAFTRRSRHKVIVAISLSRRVWSLRAAAHLLLLF